MPQPRPRNSFKAVGPAPPPVIMVVEDDADNRLMLKTLLEMKGYRVTEASDGEEALAVLAREPPPQLILMDLQLPRLNGFAVARHVRQGDGARDVPIIVVSGHDPARHRQLAIASGCNDYLLKPIDFERLEEILSRLLPIT